MLKMVDGTGIIGVDMVCPLGGAVSPPQPPNYDKVEVEGVGSLMLPNSLKAPLERVELIGNSVQLTTTGKNLLNIPFIDGSVRETPIQCNFEKPILIHAETLPKSIQSNVWRIKVVYKDNTLKYVVDSDMQKGSLFDASPENPIVYINYRGLYITEGQYEKIQVEHGVKVTPYEPYTGGKPSPSPEYPQEIKNSGKWNEEKQKYEIDVKVTGKNLFDREKARDTANWIIRDGDGYAKFPIRVGKGNKATFSYTEKLTAGKGFYLGIAKKETGSVISWLYYDTNLSISNSKYTIAAEEDYVYLMCNRSAIQTFLDVIKTLQVEISQTQTEYEPYQEPQALTLTSDRPLTKWDKLVEQGGQYGWLYGSDIKTFESDVFKLYTDNDKAIQYQVPFEEITSSWNESVCYCNTFENVSGQTIYTQSGKTDFYMGCVHKSMVFSAKNKQGIFQSIKAFQEWIRNSGTYVCYKTDNKKFVPLSESEQTQLRNLHSYNGTTNITVDSGEVPCGIKLAYRKEI